MPHAMQTMDIPREGCSFVAAVHLAAADAEQPGPRRFSGVAYGGGVITDHGWWDAVAFDLAGLQAQTPMPLLLQHDQDRSIGVIDQVDNDGAQLRIGGRLFVGTEPEADRVAAKADAGMPWQMSVGIFPDAIDEVPQGATTTVNGRAVTGKAHIFRRARVRETSFVALGADDSTRAHVFNQGGARRVPVASITKEGRMADTNDTAAALAAMTAERDAATALADAEKTRADKLAADLADLQGKFAARDRAEREAAVKQLLGEEFSADAAKPYMDMTPEQFGAVQAGFAALRSKLPAGFTAEQATGGAGAITPEAIHQYRSANPGASYEQAFAALKAPAARSIPTTFSG